MTQLAACDVGRSLLAPLDDVPDATVTPADVTGDGTLTPDVSAGTRTCAAFADCAGSCADGAGFADCLMGCARDLRPASRPLVDDVLTCVRANCDAGLSTTCAGMAVTGPCAARALACRADTAQPDGGMDVPATDGPLTTCSAAFATGFPRCSGTAGFWPCITGLRAGLAGAELTRFNALTTCVEAACGPSPSETCATMNCYEEVTACHPICVLAYSCSSATCRSADCRASFMRCGAPLAATEATRFAAVRACLERVCGATLDATCVNSTTTEAMCAAEIGACSAMPPPIDGGVDAGPDVPAVDAPLDAPIPADLPVGGLGCVDGIQHCVPSCPERDVDCMRRCASGMRASSMTLFNNLVTCLSGACGSLSSFICFQSAADFMCSTQFTACMADAPGTPPTPVCGAPMSQAGESSCGGMCVNTSYRNNANCGLCGAACAASQTCSFGACVPHGVANIALQWDGLGDVDLVVRTPCGNVVSARQPANCGATFDRSNTAGIGPESLSFAATPMTGRYTVCAIPRTTIRGTRPGARVLLDRTGMPLLIFPTPMGAATDRLGGEFRVLATTPDTTTDDCPATSPFHVADIDL